MFKTRVKEARKRKGLTQKQLAAYLNLSANAICEWEKGRSEPNFDTLKKIADYFDVSVDYLLGREDDFGVVKRESPADKDSEEFLSLYRELTPSAQEAIKETIRQLVARQNGATDTGEIK